MIWSIILIITLIVIGYQDIKKKTVHIIPLFLFFASTTILKQETQFGSDGLFSFSLKNVGILGTTIFVLAISFKRKFIGIADILMMAILCYSNDFLHFVEIVTIASITGIIHGVWSIWKYKDDKIPFCTHLALVSIAFIVKTIN